MSSSATSADTLVGHMVGRFKIDAFVGEEALGKVYSATETGTSKQVTLKMLNPTLAQNYEGAGRFQREMVAGATVAEHPNAIAMLDFGDHNGVFFYIVLETFDARPLAEELLRGPLPPERAAAIAYQVASVLNTAHQSQIVHRNITPENILLLNNAEGDYVKIRDFGLARMLDPEAGGGETLTSAGARVGTVTYQAPEYIEGGRVDPRGDLYALGIVLYEMLVGQPPFTGKKMQIVEGHLDAAVPRPKAARADVPDWLDELVYSLLRKEPEDRPRDGGLVMQTIAKGLGRRVVLPELTGKVGQSKLGGGAAVAEPADKKGGSGAAVAAGAAGLGLLLVGGGVVLLIVIGILVAVFVM